MVWGCDQEGARVLVFIVQRVFFRDIEATRCGREGIGWGPQLPMSVDEMIEFWGSGTLLLHCRVCANESAQHLNRAHLVGEIFVMSLWPQGCGRKLKAFKDLGMRILIFFLTSFFPQYPKKDRADDTL